MYNIGMGLSVGQLLGGGELEVGPFFWSLTWFWPIQNVRLQLMTSSSSSDQGLWWQDYMPFTVVNKVRARAQRFTLTYQNFGFIKSCATFATPCSFILIHLCRFFWKKLMEIVWSIQLKNISLRFINAFLACWKIYDVDDILANCCRALD